MLRTKMKPMDAVEYLAKKYFRSESTIYSIVYRRKRRLGQNSKVKNRNSIKNEEHYRKNYLYIII